MGDDRHDPHAQQHAGAVATAPRTERDDGSGPIETAREALRRLTDALSDGHAGNAAPKHGWEVAPPEPEEMRRDEVDRSRPLPGDQPPPK